MNDRTAQNARAQPGSGERDQLAIERRFLGIVEVDSGTLLIGDPAYLLSDRSRGKEGIDYQAVQDADGHVQAVAIGDQPVVLVQNFGGDGAFAVYGEFEDGEFVRLCVSLDPIELD